MINKTLYLIRGLPGAGKSTMSGRECLFKSVHNVPQDKINKMKAEFEV